MTGLCDYCNIVVDASTGYTFPENIIVHATCLEQIKFMMKRRQEQLLEEFKQFRKLLVCNWCGAPAEPNISECETCHHMPHVEPDRCNCPNCAEIYG